jgi:hypothetical protein
LLRRSTYIEDVKKRVIILLRQLLRGLPQLGCVCSENGASVIIVGNTGPFEEELNLGRAGVVERLSQQWWKLVHVANEYEMGGCVERKVLHDVTLHD